MKIIKTCSYVLTEESLEKDIDRFIRDAKNGAYQWDYKYEHEGLKTIKAYFRMIRRSLRSRIMMLRERAIKSSCSFCFRINTTNLIMKILSES